jgi:hypothetical protein
MKQVVPGKESIRDLNPRPKGSRSFRPVRGEPQEGELNDRESISIRIATEREEYQQPAKFGGDNTEIR